MKRLVKNCIRCKKCGDVIESKDAHDFETCSCGAVSVDGGLNYCRRIGAIENWEELSEWKEVEPVKHVEKKEKEIIFDDDDWKGYLEL